MYQDITLKVETKEVKTETETFTLVRVWVSSIFGDAYAHECKPTAKEAFILAYKECRTQLNPYTPIYI